MKSVLIALSFSLLSSVVWAETPVTLAPEVATSARTTSAEVLTEQAVTTSAPSVATDTQAPLMTNAELKREGRAVSVSRTTSRERVTRQSRLLRD